MFGNYVHCVRYAEKHGMNYRDIIKATEPSKIMGISTLDSIKVVTLPEEMWAPTTDPCRNRMRETEDHIKRIEQLGGRVERFYWEDY
jgi:hypothetical protein